MFQAILRVIILTDIAILRFPENYYSELAISFLPYLIGITLLWMIISFIKLRKYLKKTNIFNGPTVKGGTKGGFVSSSRMRWALLVAFGILFIIHSNTFNSFYNYKPKSAISNLWSNNQTIKVLYWNIYKLNEDYSGIQTTIENTNPDLILFVEFSENHYKHLKDFLQKNYPYINSTTWSKSFIGSMVFSKYKIENRADDFPQGRRRYAYFSLQPKDWPEQYFYLVHTSSPDSYAHFDMRNTQLTDFINDFQSHQRWYRADTDKVFVVGDFNISPRSSYYKDFEEWLGSWFIDATREFPTLFTRKFFQLPIFRAHIDHLRTNDINTIQDIKTVKIPGSDHKWLVFTVNS